MYRTTRQSRYFILVVFEAIHFSPYVVWLQMLLKALLKTLHLRYIDTNCTVCTITNSEPPSLQLVLYLCASPHFSIAQICSFIALCCRKTRFWSCAQTHLQCPATAIRLHHRYSSMYKYKFLLNSFIMCSYSTLCARSSFSKWFFVEYTSVEAMKRPQ